MRVYLFLLHLLSLRLIHSTKYQIDRIDCYYLYKPVKEHIQ